MLPWKNKKRHRKSHRNGVVVGTLRGGRSSRVQEWDKEEGEKGDVPGAERPAFPLSLAEIAVDSFAEVMILSKIWAPADGETT